jgi:hypothetical protein
MTTGTINGQNVNHGVLPSLVGTIMPFDWFAGKLLGQRYTRDISWIFPEEDKMPDEEWIKALPDKE